MPIGPQTTSETSPSEGEREALGMLSAINTSEINAANLALQKQVQGGARDYATRMIKEHTDNNQKIAKWQPDTSAAGAKLQMTKGKAELAKLQTLDGPAFETAYITAMVKDHNDALTALDKKLIPQAKTPPVLEHLQTTRHHVADHLSSAKALQAAGKNAGAR
ncbi:UNVERIFIED_ORG: putative membrane protein [Xanthomonas axonopodis]